MDEKLLTGRELDILNCAKEGLSNEEIAEKLFISKHTSKAHISSIIKKLNAKNRTNAIYKALKLGFID